MKKIAYLCVSCDTDPDINPPYLELPNPGKCDDIWQGIVAGIPVLRQRLAGTHFVAKYGQLPVTWLLRCDRQIYEIYGDPSFCFKRFERTWEGEQKYGSEIGWHPHLYRWDAYAGRWTEYLGKDDDLEVLAECLSGLRRCADVRTVRTGWVYHSNTLMKFFDKEGLFVDASAVPGTVQSGTWFFDWRGAPRTPYRPSYSDYRRPAGSSERSLSIIEMPVLVRSLSLPLQLSRYCVRKLRAISGPGENLTDWESSRFQGLRVTSNPGQFCEAVEQTLVLSPEDKPTFLNTYFHTNELLSARSLERFISNLDNASRLAERAGRKLIPITLCVAASVVAPSAKFSGSRFKVTI